MVDAHTPISIRRGDSFSVSHVFDAAGIADFARRTGDRNPFHHDSGAAVASRFGRRIASAQQTTSLMLGLAASWVAERGFSFVLGCSFRFTAAVLEGDAIDLRWVVVDTIVKESLDGVIVVLEGKATNSSGRVCARGMLEVLLQG